jgi:ParB-like chromosome segregation protein Spo0J
MDIFFDNEFRNLIPPLQPDERITLEASLKTEGNRDPVVIWKETKLMLDGHNRYDICTNAGIRLKPALELSFPDRNAAMVWIIQNQFGRRNLQPYVVIKLRMKLAELLESKGIENMSRGGGDRKSEAYKSGFHMCENPIIPPEEHVNSVKELAKASGVSTNTIAKVKVIEAKATEDQKEKLVSGEATINQVFVAIRRDEVKEQVKQTDWPVGKYRVIYADPPWQYSNSMPVDMATQQEDHYPTMPVSEICKLPVSDLALDNAVLFLWATSPILEESFGVIRAWGFKYKAFFVYQSVRIPNFLSESKLIQMGGFFLP